LDQCLPAGNPVDSPRAALAIGAISGAGALVVSAAPIVVGMLAGGLAFDSSQLGDIMLFYNIGFTALVVVALLFIRNLPWRHSALIASAAAAAGFAVLPHISSFAGIALLFATIGVAAGLLYALGMAIAGESDNADRAFGLKLGMESLPSVLILFLVPAVVLPWGGISAAAIVFALTFALLGLTALLLPPHRVGRREPVDQGHDQVDGWQVEGWIERARAAPPRSGLWLSFAALVASIVFVTGVAATWSFLEVFATDRAFAPAAIGLVLSSGFGVAALGGFVVAAIGTRFGRTVPMAGVFMMQASGLALIGSSDTIVAFAAGTFLFLGSINFGLAFLFGLSAAIDPSGRFVVLSATTLSVGGGLGPAIGGRLIELGGRTHVLLFSLLCFALTFAIFATVEKISRSRNEA
jgi:hypothetical protein